MLVTFRHVIDLDASRITALEKGKHTYTIYRLQTYPLVDEVQSISYPFNRGNRRGFPGFFRGMECLHKKLRDQIYLSLTGWP